MSTRTEQRATEVVRDPRWTAVLGRDRASDGKFFYSVKTTGVFCRPSCAARTPRPENVAFHSSVAAAEKQGFRPCKRCRPKGASVAEDQARRVAEICQHLERAENTPSLAELADRTGWSVYHLHRVFRAVTGLTPKAYAEGRRAERMRTTLGRSRTVTEAIYDAGYNSSGRFYEKADDVLGMTPATFRAGGARAEIRFAIGECSLGSILVASSSRGVCAISLGNDPATLARELQDRFPQAELIGGDAEFERLVAEVVGLVEAPRVGFDLPLDVRGTAFQERVWRALRKIPAGETASYRDIAQRIGFPKAIRAVAQACAANTLAVAIPCHRVVRSDGAASGYRWGVERKLDLLRREKASP
ncbi:MAG TPA: bifunctional DNA-binding transcriptional regulator/O6-methylguanine-DNA methyltransferase Ada [Polyangiaceae bacterium]|jgi:AraC family transcriptional regulator of adaptative response/methylated-DNA-[protein]-cysteine methyltransferase|nr:bifunctional DNA-binding transcriptional regulator/O6-methylguanine-DNA methyltransferase Ada [Polyangiaceae bacterium]